MLSAIKINFGSTQDGDVQQGIQPKKANKPNVDVRKINWIIEHFGKEPIYIKHAPDDFQENFVGVPFVESNGMFLCVFNYDKDTNEKQKTTYNYSDGMKIYSIETYFDDGKNVHKHVLAPGSCNGKPLCYVRYDEYGDVVRKITRGRDGKPVHQFKSMYSSDDDELCQLEYSGIELVNIANFRNGRMYRHVEFEKVKPQADDANLPSYDKPDPDFVAVAMKNDNCHYCRANRIVTFDSKTNLETSVYAGDDFIPPSKYVTNEKEVILLHETYHRSNFELAERTIYHDDGQIDEKYSYDENGELIAHNKYIHRDTINNEESHHNIFVHKTHKKIRDRIREIFKK